MKTEDNDEESKNRRSSRAELTRRITKLQQVVKRMEENDKVTFAGLAEKIGDGSTNRQISYALEKCRETLSRSGRRIRIGQSYLQVLEIEETQFDRRLRNSVEEKRAIGDALWSFLFGFNLPEGLTLIRNWEVNPTETVTVNNGRKGNTASSDEELTQRVKSTPTLDDERRLQVQQMILKKVRILKNRTNLDIMIDAGSTTAIASECFLDSVPNVPFRVTTKNSDDGKDVFRVVTPIFITNSIYIADQVGRSKFRWEITLRVIGGTDRVDRRSLCGDLSLLWLRACHHEGKMVSVDLSVIGSTGCESELFGEPTLCCDDSAETALKSRMLAMGHLRVVIFESIKLIEGSTSYTFAPVSSSAVDLIVIDDGSRVALENEVIEFSKAAMRNGVAVLIVGKSGGFRGEDEQDL